MSKFRIINLIDKLFISLCVFLIIYAWINFYIRNLWATFILSLIFSFAVLFVLFFMLGKRQEKFSNSKKENEEFNKTILAFRLTPRKEKYKLLCSILKINHKTELVDSNLIYYVGEEKHLVIIATHVEKLTETDIISIIDENYFEGVNCIDIVCNVYAGNRLNFVKNLKINIVNNRTLYADFCKTGILPNMDILDSDITKLSIKDIAKNMLQPAKAKAYFLCGLVLIFSSIILPYHYYYLIFGSMFMLFSIICKLMPRFS